MKLEEKQNKADLKLVEVASLNTTQAEELADLRAVLEACEDKWYKEGFADTENSTKPIMNEAWRLGFKGGWLAALQALGIPKDFPLKDPGQIPLPSFTLAVQNPPTPIDEEEMASMRELVEKIDTHAKLDDMEATGIPRASDQLSEDIL